MKLISMLPIILLSPTLAQLIPTFALSFANLPKNLRPTYFKLLGACFTGSPAATAIYGDEDDGDEVIYSYADGECFYFSKDEEKAKLLVFCKDLKCRFGVSGTTECQNPSLSLIRPIFPIAAGLAFPNPLGIASVVGIGAKCDAR